jgi:hypothetical protein
MGTDTDQRQRGWMERDMARVVALLVPILLGGGYIGVQHAGRVDNDTSMLESHTDALRQRVDYLEDWIARHRRTHMEED